MTTLPDSAERSLSEACHAIEQFDRCSRDVLDDSTPGWENVGDLFWCMTTFAHLTALLPTVIERMMIAGQIATLAGDGPFDAVHGAQGAEVLMSEARDAFARASRHAILLQDEIRAAAELITWAFDVDEAGRSQ